MSSSIPRAGVAAMLAVAAGCSGDFDPYGRLTALRVLAVQSEPVAPAAGETTTLTPLIYTPPGDAVAELRWSWCPFAGGAADGAPCLLTEDELRALAVQAGADPASIPPYDLGSGATASLDHAVPTALLDRLCDGTASQPAVVDCLGGFPVQIRVAVKTSTAEVITVRRLRLRRNGDPANTNPTIDGLGALDSTGEHALTEEPTVSLPRGVETTLRAAVRPEMSETYPSIDVEDRPVTVRERLILSWFVESGDTSAGRTGFIDGVVPLEEAVENEWEPALVADYGRETSRLVVVLRDNREGVSWRSASVRLDGAP